MIQKTLNYIKNQTGLNCELCDYFHGIREHKGKQYFNIILKDRISESMDFIKLENLANKYKKIKVEINGLNRVSIFFNIKELK